MEDKSPEDFMRGAKGAFGGSVADLCRRGTESNRRHKGPQSKRNVERRMDEGYLFSWRQADRRSIQKCRGRLLCREL